jgi:hypothetical protein
MAWNLQCCSVITANPTQLLLHKINMPQNECISHNAMNFHIRNGNQIMHSPRVCSTGMGPIKSLSARLSFSTKKEQESYAATPGDEFAILFFS